MEQKKKREIWFYIIIAAVCVIIITVVTILLLPYFIKLSDPVYQEKFKEWVTNLGFRGWFIVLGIQIIQIVIAFIPGGPVEVLSGILYGVLGGTAVCLLGSIIASSLIFLIVRKFGLPLLYKLFGKEKIDGFAFLKDSKRIETAAFILFLLPGIPKDMFTYVAGVSGLKLPRFLLITTFARIPFIASSAAAGSTLRHGNWTATVIIFLVTAVIGLAGIHYKDKIIDYCRRAGEHIKHKKEK